MVWRRRGRAGGRPRSRGPSRAVLRAYPIAGLSPSLRNTGRPRCSPPGRRPDHATRARRRRRPPSAPPSPRRAIRGRVVATMSTPVSVTVRSTATLCRAIGWHSGTRSGVRLAPMIPASRPTRGRRPWATPSPRSSATTLSGRDFRRRTASRASQLSRNIDHAGSAASSTWVSRDSSGIPRVYIRFRETGLAFPVLQRHNSSATI